MRDGIVPTPTKPIKWTSRARGRDGRSGSLNGVSRARVSEVQRVWLLGVAVDVALECGFRRELMGRVAARGGVSREVLEGALGDREECLVAVFDAVVERLAARGFAGELS